MFDKLLYSPEKKFENLSLEAAIYTVKTVNTALIYLSGIFAGNLMITTASYYMVFQKSGFISPPYSTDDSFMTFFGFLAVGSALASSAFFTQYSRNKKYLNSLEEELNNQAQ